MTGTRQLVCASLAFTLLAGCSGGGGTTGGGTVVTLTPTPSPTVTLTPSAATGFIGDSVTLTWASTNATGCTASGGWAGALATSGTQSVTIAAATNSFKITCASGSLSASADASVAGTVKPFFTEIPGALSVATKIDGTASSADMIALIDINADGKKDLAIHQVVQRYSGSTTGPEPSANALHFYIQQSDGSFRDQTSTYLIGSPDLGGDSRKVKVADINGDGKADLLYAINQEDGRLLPVASYANAQLAAVVSTATGYVVRKMGIPNWYHSVGAGRDVAGRAFMTGNGYSDNNRGSWYLDAAGTVTQTGLTLPQISPTSFEFYNDRLDSGFTDRLVQAANGTANYLTAQGYTASGSGVWSAVTPLEFSPIVGMAHAIAYNGDDGGMQPVFNIDGINMTFAGLSESCVTRLTPTSGPVVLFELSGSVIPSFTDGMTVRQNDLALYNTIVGAKIEGGAVVRVPLTITNLQTAIAGFNFACRDVNGDSYADIVMYPIGADARPYVYLNDKAGGFAFLGQSQFPSIGGADGWLNSASSISGDLDGDGIEDLIIGPFLPIVTAATSAQWHVYRGLKPLQ